MAGKERKGVRKPATKFGNLQKKMQQAEKSKAKIRQAKKKERSSG